MEKIHIKQVNKSIDFMKNFLENLYFYDTYFLCENKNAGISVLSKVNYNEIYNVYISENIFIIRLTGTKHIMIIDKNGFQLGTLDEFIVFLQENFQGKIIDK